MVTSFQRKPIPTITWQTMAPPFRAYAYYENSDQFPFQWDVDVFSLINAWWLSEAALLAYAQEAFARPRFLEAGFRQVRFFNGDSTQCYVASDDHVAMVAFRGTECGPRSDDPAYAHFIADLKADFNAMPTDDGQGGKIHTGFKDALDEVWPVLAPLLQSMLDDGCRIWLTGHSLGGALAILANQRFKKTKGVYTFGAPRVGDARFVSGCSPKPFCFVNNNDVVPHLPPFPYMDSGHLRYIDRNGDIHEKMNFWERRLDEIQGHIQCIIDSVKHGWPAFMPDGLRDHTPVLYALHIWNNLVGNGQDGANR
jgi:triacylglycerol lipase